MNKIIVIVGPTASGKTDLSIKLAKKFNGECINSDSTQIFKGTDIATNKITEEEMQGIKHHLISIREVNEKYSVADFQKDAREKIDEILKKGKTPIIVGGTGLYVNAVLMNYNFANEDHIENFEKKYDNFSNQEIWKILNSKDNNEAQKIHPNNRNRVIRALEIIEINKGIEKTKIIKDNKKYFYNNLLFIGLFPQRDKLYSKINNRVFILSKKGLFKEIENAYKANNFNKKAQALKCIGGPEIIRYLEKEITYDECIELMQKNNRHYARRQLTWFRNQLENIKWFEHDYENYDQITDEIVDYIELNI
ncbi:tRNA (adenosine(37)-N6)-dimethylallyltransferase MiaA [Spiroplasma floricola]|uniref:tRNA dimethylallyltransferase n=1 Tax=Spiroplasma floricola 23-6 TaxID=1336749 RepID=A0A2K8SDG5_9MOLU|nr:tRNA (adenosine(37)-N6)-dimethylallyltransferase MiaA [Spiroplasma floricola]AUB31463.1 tRNA delta(2)-isopentenylpyrophosphate transferase [Spiroplasma floricola 23-6]